ncbi:hypothetical protein BDZ89DRAFT_1136821 [Hymenopellis radicata]|nr:hypothetical protein BDZ89DRAFT_1136821 [Hymenopellis radicata]
MSPVDYDACLYAFLRGARSLQPPEEHWFRQQLLEIDDELSLLSQLQVFDPREPELYELRAKYAAPSSPVYHLPPELILEIFISSCSSSQSILDTRNSTSWIICRVCARWRAIALCSPSLWRTVIFSSPYPRRSADILSEYVTRSGDHCLTISLTLSEAHNFYEEMEWERIISGIVPVLLRSCHRWKKVQIQAPQINILSPLLSIPGTLPHLEELYLVQTRSWYRNMRQPPFLIPQQLLGAPLLRKLGIVEHRLTKDMLYLSPNITHFSGYIYALREVQQLLSLPNLVECRISVTILMFDEVPPQYIVFPHLQRLSVDSVGVLRALLLPKLDSFSLTALYMSEGITVILEDFLNRFPCALLCVTAPVVLLPVLKMPHDSLQSVRRLSMPFSNKTSKPTLGVLAILRTGVLPRLEAVTLMVYGSPSTNTAFEPLLDTISYRLQDNNVQKLRSLRLCLCSVGVAEEMRRQGLARFESDGLIIDHNQSESD